jgi:hypothetical protein
LSPRSSGSSAIEPGRAQTLKLLLPRRAPRNAEVLRDIDNLFDSDGTLAKQLT